jgi:glycosyltransferase involved in cell wall biosynthesis
MKIALISPPLLLTPPRGYGGLERVVYDLGCALVEQGEEVTLFAPPGSHIDGGKLVETVSAPERTDVNWVELEKTAYEGYREKLVGFDIIHDHSWFGFPYLAKIDPAFKDLKICHTHHGHCDWNPGLVPEQIKPVSLIGISEFMMNEYKSRGWNSKYVYNGIDISKHPYSDVKDNRLVFVGRISKIKMPHAAIKVAIECDIPIDIIGGSFVDDKSYLEAIKTECENSKGIATLHLDLDHAKKVELVQHAKACLIPSKFGEPFGLTAVESISCGTPAICFDDGALKEIVNTPSVGSICRDYDAFLKAVQNIDSAKYDPKACRIRANYFTREKMAERYTKLYKEVVDGKGW